MPFDFTGYVLRAPRTAPSNAPTSGEPNNGVVRDVRSLPASYDLAAEVGQFQQPEMLELYADQYRAGILQNDATANTEYLVWAENNSQIGILSDPDWWQEAGAGYIPTGSLTVVDASPFPLAVGEVEPAGYGFFTDGASIVIVTDNGGRSLAQITTLVVRRGDVDDYDDRGWVDPEVPASGRKGFNPYLVLEIDAADQSPTAGVVTLTDAQLVTLDGGLSKDRGDTIYLVRYTVSPSRFWWTRNDKDETRFGWSDKAQKWVPFKGSAPKALGALAFDTEYQLDPVPLGFPVGSYLPGDTLDPDTYAMIRLGNNPGAGTQAIGTIKVKFDADLEGGFDFSKDPNVSGVAGVASGVLQFNPAFVELNAGETIWYSPRTWADSADGVVGLMADAIDGTLFISPVPSAQDHPFISFGSRSYLTPLLVATEADLALLSPLPGSVVIARSTGRLRFSSLDLGKVDLTSSLFDKEYLGEQVVYSGIAMCAQPQPLKKPVALVDSTGLPASVELMNELFIPDATSFPVDFLDVNDLHRGLGTSGVLDVPDGTGSLPTLPGTPASVRPGGDVSGDPNTGRIRQIEDGIGDTILFSSKGQITTVNVVNRDEDLPLFPWYIKQGQAYASRIRGVAGSKVVLSRADRNRFRGTYLYFAQATMTPAYYTTLARVQSRERDYVSLQSTDTLCFVLSGVPYLWTAAALVASLPGRSLYSMQEVADDINGTLNSLDGEALVDQGYLVLQGVTSVEIGFGHDGTKDLSGCAALGFMPGWRAVEGVVNWLPEAGVAFGFYRSPTNLDRSDATSDYYATSRFSDLIVHGNVQAIPFVFLDFVPLRDVAGYDQDTFFQITSVTQEGNTVQVVVQPLKNFDQIQYRFPERKFAWLDRQRVSRFLETPVNVLNLGQTSVVPESMLGAPGIGGGLFAAEQGGPLVRLEEGIDYLLPTDGVDGTAVLIEPLGKLLFSGSRGTYQAGGIIFTDTSVTFTDQVFEGDRLKLAELGSFIITGVSGSTLLVTPPFPSDSVRATPWDVFNGETEAVYDASVIADVVYQDFSHLPNEPFVVNLLTPLGLVQNTSRIKADMAEALNRVRNISIRYGLATPDSSNIGAMIALTTTVLGTIANDALYVPTGTDRFAGGYFTLQVGGDTFTPTGVITFSTDPGTGDGIEYDRFSGLLKFGSNLLDAYESANVVFAESFQNPASLADLSVEFDPLTGEINFSQGALTAFSGTLALFVQEMILEGKLDISVSPLIGSFGFQTPVQTGQIVEVSYYKADLEGRRIGDPITEFLPLFVQNEVATRVDSRNYTFNSASTRYLDTRVPPIVRAGVLQQNFGGAQDFSVTYEGDVGKILFNQDFTDQVVVKVSYAVLDATGGERSYDASNRPLYRPPFFIKAATTVVGIRGDRTGDFVPGQMLRVGGDCFYLKAVNYFPLRYDEGPPAIPFGPPTLIPAGDVTSLVIFPPTFREVGSRSPANDLISYITDDPIAVVVDPDAETPVYPNAPAGFWHELDLTVHPFEPVNRNQNTILFLGIVPFAVAGNILEVDGHPFSIEQVDVYEDGTRTQFTLSGTFSRGFSVASASAVRISVRPIYPPNTKDFLSVGGVLRNEPLELILFGETDDSGNTQPGRTLRRDVDYSLDFDNGLVRFLDAQVALAPHQKLVLSYTRLKVLQPLLKDGQVLYPRLKTDFLYATTPSTANGLIGSLVTGTYTYRNPDSYYCRIVPMAAYMGEVAKQAVKDITARQPAGGSMVSQPGANAENFDRGNLGLLAQRRDLLDRDRASRVFLDFYNTLICTFEQIQETISGIFIGDRDGKFKFFVGRGKEHALPGWEDEITGYLNPKYVWEALFDTEDGNNAFRLLPEDNVVLPPTAVLTSGVIEGTFVNPSELRDLIYGQQPFIRNDVDDVVLVSLKRVRPRTTYPFMELRARGVFRRMSDSHGLSRIFPTLAKAFLITYPGIGADVAQGDMGVFSYGKTVGNRTFSTYQRTIGQLANPVLGEIEGVTHATLSVRRSRARVFAYSPTGFAGLTTVPSLMATPGLLSDFPLDPETGAPDVARFLSQGGDLADLETGEAELANPGFAQGQQVSWGFPDGTIRMAYCSEGLDVFGTPSLAGLFIGSVIQGCILTFQTPAGAAITDPDAVLVATGPDTGLPAETAIFAGCTIFAIPPVGMNVALPDPLTLDSMDQLRAGAPSYRIGTDVGLRTDGRLVDISMPSRHDPFFLAIKEWSGQNTPPPGSALEADVNFYYSGQNPLEIPALQGLAQDDDGDYQIPYLTNSNTEKDRFTQSAPGFSQVLTEQDPNNIYVYPDEVVGTDGEIVTAFAAGFGNGTYKEPATLMTRRDATPVANGNTDLGIGDVNRYDLLLVEVGLVGNQGYKGILTVGDVRTAQTSLAPSEYSSWIEPPRFVTPTTPRTVKSAFTLSPVRYVFNNAICVTNDPGSYTNTPQVDLPAGVDVESDSVAGTTTLDFSSLGQLALNDNLTTGTGNLNDIWAASANNRIKIAFLSREDVGIALAPGALPVPAGEIVYTVEIQGLQVTSTDYWGNVVVTALTAPPVFGAGPSITPADNQQIVLTTAAPWFDFQGANPADRAAWYLPHTETAPGVNHSIYGWEFSISIDTYNIATGPKGESTTAWVDEDRLTFHEVFDMRRIKERGYTHPLSGLLLNGQLVVHEVTLGGGVPSTVLRQNNGAIAGTPVPFTFPARSITASSFGVYQHNDAGGSWTPAALGDVPEVGGIRVMGFEGSLNTPISATDVTFSAIPSCPGQIGLVAICDGSGFTESKNNTAVAGAYRYDDRITGITASTLGSEGNVLKGDILTIQASTDATHIATAKAGTYLVRHTVPAPQVPPALSNFFDSFGGDCIAGSGTGWAPFEFPSVVSYDSGTLELVASDLFSYQHLPILTAEPSGFDTTGRVFIVRDVAGLAQELDGLRFLEAVISAEYSSINEATKTFQITGGYLYADGVSVPTAAEFARLATDGAHKISGMRWLPVIPGNLDPALPKDNLVGWDLSSPNGFRFVTMRAPATITAAGFLDFGTTYAIEATATTPTALAVEAGPVETSFDFTTPENAVVYPDVAVRMDLSEITGAQWTTLYDNGGALSPVDVACILPGTRLELWDSTGLLEGFQAQTGIFLEPSFMQPTFDLNPSGIAHVVDSDHSVYPIDIGMRNLEILAGLVPPGNLGAAPAVPENVQFQVRRIRRFHEVQNFIGRNLEPLKYVYRIRRGRITVYTPNPAGNQQGIVEASGFNMTFNTDWAAAPKAGDVWNTGLTITEGTDLGAFNDANVNINPGDMFRVLDENGDLLEEVEIVGVVAHQLRLAAPGLQALAPGDYTLDGGYRFEVYLHRAPVPHEQTMEQLLELMTARVVHRTFADEDLLQGGYVPEIQTGEEYRDVANNLYDDLNAAGGNDTFAALGVRPGDIVLIDPAGTLFRNEVLPAIKEKGSRPYGDFGVAERAAGIGATGISGNPTYVAGTPASLDDNRGYYRVEEVVDDPTPHLVLTGASTYSGDQDTDVAFPESPADLEDWGYAIYPTIHASELNDAAYVDTGVPDGREGQQDLRPTKIPDPVTNSYRDYSGLGAAYSLRPFTYRIIRPSTLFSDAAIDLILSSRERMLSLMEVFEGLMDGRKTGTYFVFQRDRHIHDLGNPANPAEGAGVLSNIFLQDLIGRMDVVPFANTADALSILDRRFWILDRQLDQLTARDIVTAQKAGFGDIPYTAFTDAVGSVVRPVLPDRVDIVLDVEDRFRSFRQTWLAYRTHKVLGTLAGIQRYDEQLPERKKEQQRLLDILVNTK